MGSDLGWFALNVGDGATWNHWQEVRDIAASNGVTTYPWARCRNLQGLEALLTLAVENAVQPLPNLESELEDELPAHLVAETAAEYPVDVVGYSCLGWLQNSVEWEFLYDKPVLLQLFVSDMRRDPSELPQIQRECVLHARELGFKNVGVTYQTYGAAEPSWYDYWQGTRSFYTADDIALDWEAWA